MSESTPNGPNPSESTSLVTVIDHNGTYAPIHETMIAVIPDSIIENSDRDCTSDVEQFLKEGDYDHMMLGEVKDSDTILRFFRIFFPNMEVNTDNEGQILIYTGLYPNGEPDDE